MKKYVEKRPWGKFERLTHNKNSTVKIITANSHSKLSYQYHNHRDEFWKILWGSGIVVLDGKEIPCKEGDEFEIPRKTKHRMMTNGEPITWLEIAFGDFDEEDIVRISDEYGRT